MKDFPCWSIEGQKLIKISYQSMLNIICSTGKYKHNREPLNVHARQRSFAKNEIKIQATDFR
jgi:predicted metal-dependent phosphotriesterase family hydrolase